MLARWLPHLMAGPFNQYASSPYNRSYCYSELTIFPQ